MSNYHHQKIEKLDDFRHLPIVINPKSMVRKHIQGYVIAFLF